MFNVQLVAARERTIAVIEQLIALSLDVEDRGKREDVLQQAEELEKLHGLLAQHETDADFEYSRENIANLLEEIEITLTAERRRLRAS
jgi:hypothetical protein